MGQEGVCRVDREGVGHQLVNVIQTSAETGMQTRDQALKSLCERGLITFEMALAYASSQEELRRMMRRVA